MSGLSDNFIPAPRRMKWGRVYYGETSVLIAEGALREKHIEEGYRINSLHTFTDLSHLSLSYANAAISVTIALANSSRMYRSGERASSLPLENGE